MGVATSKRAAALRLQRGVLVLAFLGVWIWLAADPPYAAADNTPPPATNNAPPPVLPGAMAPKPPPAASATLVNATQVDATGATSSLTLDCYPVTYFSSNAAGQFATAEYGYNEPYTGMIRARSTTLGPWQMNRWCIDESSGAWVLQFVAANSYFVSAELGYSPGTHYYGMLRARSDTIGAWEKYAIQCQNTSGAYAFKSTANNMWVSTELGYTGSDKWMLRARSSSVGPWEQYFAGPMCEGG
jgi:hypothetical protein